MAFKKATKEQSKLRLALCGLAGSGKTYSALSIAKNLIPGARIAVIDTERGSASLYADKFDFDVVELESFSPLAYVEQIKAAEAEGYDIIIVDSLTHAWAGKDGALDQKDKASDRDPRGNSWTAWRNVTPKHNALVDAILQVNAHVIATMRTKMEYVQEKNEKTGKTEIKKVGLAAIQREGMEYEFTLVGDIDLTHTLKISKTRVDSIDIGDQFEKAGEMFARKVYAWLMSGAAPAPRALVAAVAPTEVKTIEQPQVEQPSAPAVAPVPNSATRTIDAAFTAYLESMTKAPSVSELDASAAGPGKPAKGTDEYRLATGHYRSCKALLEDAAKRSAEHAKAVEPPQAVAS